MLSLIGSALGGLFGGGSGGSLLSTIGGNLLDGAMQNLPGLLGQGGSGGGVSRSILDLDIDMSKSRSMMQQSMLMGRARQTAGAARAFMSGSGFRGGAGSQTALYDKSMLNLASDISQLQYDQRAAELTQGISSAQQAIAESRQMSPIANLLFGSVIKPLASAGLSKLGGKLFGGGGGSSSANLSSATQSGNNLMGMKGSDLFNEHKGSLKPQYRSNLQSMKSFF